MQRRLVILGSTGSIGTQALEIVKKHSNIFSVEALTAHKNKELLFEQVRIFRPKLAGLTKPIPTNEIPKDLKFCKWVMGEEALSIAASQVPCDDVLVSVVGMVGLKGVLEGLKSGKRILLANKEALVAGGDLVVKTASEACIRCENKDYGVNKVAIWCNTNENMDTPNACFSNGTILPSPLSRIIPVDSEHSAIFQCIYGSKINKINKIFLTCSGGPFLNWDKQDIDNATVKQALNHPRWNMGPKITIDSASLFNKSLEIMEACKLFNVDEKNIEVLIHPQSIIHSMVGFKDGAIIAQLGKPSMKVPIAFAMSYPKRIETDVEFPDFSQFTFENPDTERFPAINIGRNCIREGGAACAVFNAANEIAVAAFLSDKIKFGDITKTVEKTLDKLSHMPANSFDEIIYADTVARRTSKGITEKIN